MTEKAYLLYVKYEYYCQGTEETWGYFLVYGTSAKDVMYRMNQHTKVRHVINKTLDKDNQYPDFAFSDL